MKTTIIGLLAAAAAALQTSIQSGASLLDWQSWIFPVTIALLGYHAKDATR
jgi:hypothetical protein